MQNYNTILILINMVIFGLLFSFPFGCLMGQTEFLQKNDFSKKGITTFTSAFVLTNLVLECLSFMGLGADRSQHSIGLNMSLGGGNFFIGISWPVFYPALSLFVVSAFILALGFFFIPENTENLQTQTYEPVQT